MLERSTLTSVAAAAVAVSAAALYRHLIRGARLYVCGQQTPALNPQLTAFLGWRRTEQPIKAAMPPFNRRPNMELKPTTVQFNAPVFGPAISNAAMGLFDSPEMRALSTELGVRIPHYQLSSFVQKKAPKVKTLVSVARTRSDCASGPNAAAVEKLDRFITEFEKLSASDIPSLKEWKAFCAKHCPTGYEGKLHFDHVLTFCFGFEPDTAAALRAHKHEIKDPASGEVEVKSLQEWSVRWLSKSLGAYGPDGCLGDAVNLALAMLHREQPDDVSEAALVAALTNVRAMLDRAARGQTSDLAACWLPTHMQMDAEADDTLSWLLAERARRLLQLEPLRVLCQLGTEPKMDAVASHIASKGAIVFRDPESKNADAVLKNFAHL